MDLQTTTCGSQPPNFCSLNWLVGKKTNDRFTGRNLARQSP
jgi:hypothetical protein